MEEVASGPCHLQVLRGVPPAMSAGAIPSVPALPSTLRPQESGQGHPCREAALILQGSLSGLQQEGTCPAQVSLGWGGYGVGQFLPTGSTLPWRNWVHGLTPLSVEPYLLQCEASCQTLSELQGSNAVKAS